MPYQNKTKSDRASAESRRTGGQYDSGVSGLMFLLDQKAATAHVDEAVERHYVDVRVACQRSPCLFAPVRLPIVPISTNDRDEPGSVSAKTETVKQMLAIFRILEIG